MTDWKLVDAFCPKCGHNTVYKQDDALEWPRFCCKSCDILFNLKIFIADTVRVIDES